MDTDAGLRLVNCCFNPTNVTCTQKGLYVSTSLGFRVLRISDGSAKSIRDHQGGVYFLVNSMQNGLALAVSLSENPLVAMVGTADNTEMPCDRIFFWNDSVGSRLGDFGFHSPVVNLMMRRDRFIAVCEKTVRSKQVSVYSLSKMSSLAKFDTVDNPTGVAAISYDTSVFVLAILDVVQGSVRVHNFTRSETKTAALHNSPISLVALDFQGRLCATASQQGTVIRVFRCEDMAVLYELRRGRYAACLTSLSFCPSLEYLCGTSDHCTLHVWRLQESAPSIIGGILGTMMSSYKFEPSIAKLRLAQGPLMTSHNSRLTGPVAFFSDNSEIMVACLDGTLHRIEFDAVSGSLQPGNLLNFLEDQLTLRQSLMEPVG
jgi:WD40 repeat protein